MGKLTAKRINHGKKTTVEILDKSNALGDDHPRWGLAG